jgi:hypothetical protein
MLSTIKIFPALQTFSLMLLSHQHITPKMLTGEGGRTPAAANGRLECRKDMIFNKEWNGKLYSTKQVRPIFVEI